MQEDQDTPEIWIDSDSDLTSDESFDEEEVSPPPRKKRKRKDERGYRGKYWCFTENDPTGIVSLLEAFKGEAVFHDSISYIYGQVETGKEGRAHFQGYVEMVLPHRLSAMKKKVSKSAHFEKRFGTQTEAIKYCQKEEGRIDGPYEFGTKSLIKTGERSDLLVIKDLLHTGKTVAEIADTDEFTGTMSRHYKFFLWFQKNCCLKSLPRNGSVAVKVILLFGETSTGKTDYACTRFKGAYWKPSQSKWWDGYNGEDTVIFDDFNSGWFKWDTMMRVTDKYSLKVEYKGGYVDYCATTMIFTTNTNPLFWYKSMCGKYPSLARRFTQVLHFTADEDWEEKETWEQVQLKDLPLLGQPTEIINYS